jgi:hypothetical protein
LWFRFATRTPWQSSTGRTSNSCGPGGRGEVSGQHDATVLASGNLLIFDNDLEGGHSRVIELDPLQHEIVWEYRGGAEGFFTLTRGSSQCLPNVNTRVANSESGTPSR